MQSSRAYISSLQTAKMGKMYLAWENTWLDMMLGRGSAYAGVGILPTINSNKTNPRLLAVEAERSIQDVVKSATSADGRLTLASYIIMLVYVSTVFYYHRNVVYSRVAVSIGGLMLVCFSCIAAIGFAGYLNIPISAITLRVGPFLGLGLGLHDFFLLCHYYKLEGTMPPRTHTHTHTHSSSCPLTRALYSHQILQMTSRCEWAEP